MLVKFLLVVGEPSGLAHADHMTVVVCHEADELCGVAACRGLGVGGCSARVVHARQVAQVEKPKER